MNPEKELLWSLWVGFKGSGSFLCLGLTAKHYCGAELLSYRDGASADTWFKAQKFYMK